MKNIIEKINREVFNCLEGLTITKPMANYNSCRLKEPVDGAEYAYETCAGKHEGKCIDHVYMVPPGKKSILQALRYKKSIWTTAAARSHCNSRGGKFNA